MDKFIMHDNDEQRVKPPPYRMCTDCDGDGEQRDEEGGAPYTCPRCRGYAIVCRECGAAPSRMSRRIIFPGCAHIKPVHRTETV